MAEDDAESTPTWVSLLSAPYRIARPAGSTLEDAWQWIVREGKAGRIPARGWIQDEREGPGWMGAQVDILPSAYENIDRATGTLRLSPSEVITNIELQVDALRRAGRWPPPNIEVIERGKWTVRRQWTAVEAIDWLVLRKLPDGKGPSNM
jgi:hypothetical protein